MSFLNESQERCYGSSFVMSDLMEQVLAIFTKLSFHKFLILYLSGIDSGESLVKQEDKQSHNFLLVVPIHRCYCFWEIHFCPNVFGSFYHIFGFFPKEIKDGVVCQLGFKVFEQIINGNVSRRKGFTHSELHRCLILTVKYCVLLWWSSREWGLPLRLKEMIPWL